jgi:4-amino-4-deoxy-L-arabinose transferase-like glycosyltransferase
VGHAPVTAWRRVLVIAGVAAAARFAFLAGLELYADEAYYWTWSLRPAFGYYDHPPMVAWLAGLSSALFPSEMGLRALFVGCSALAILFAALTAKELSDDPRAPVWAALFAAVAPMLTLTGAMALPDAPLEAAYAAAVWLVVRATGRTWLWAGLAWGLAMLSKYTGGLIAPAMVVALAFDPTLRAEMKTKWPWLGGLVATLVFAPCLVWNAQHDFVSIRFQLGHGFNRAGSLGETAAYLGAVLAGLGPVVAGLAGWWFVKAPSPPRGAGSTGARVRLAALTLFPLAITTWSALRGHVEANWAALVYPSLCAAAGAALVNLSARRVAWLGGFSVAFGLAVASFFAIEVRSPHFASPKAPPIERFHGWRDLTGKIVALEGAPPPYAQVSNYQDASELAYYAGWRRFGATFARPSQFDLWATPPSPGERVVVVSRHPFSPENARDLRADETPPVQLDAVFAGTAIRTLWVTPSSERSER